LDGTAKAASDPRTPKRGARAKQFNLQSAIRNPQFLKAILLQATVEGASA
jgi:hypothetical protein